MNDLIVDVKLWGQSVGSLYWEKESNAALFDYERKFIRSGLDISPIIMPISQYRNTPYRFLENRTDCFKGLPGLFADSPQIRSESVCSNQFNCYACVRHQIEANDALVMPL